MPPDGIDALCDLLQLEDGDSASFCDLGSGGGDALLGVAARHELRGGVLASPLASRHERAVEALGLARGAAASGVSLLRTPSVSLSRATSSTSARWRRRSRRCAGTHAYSRCVPWTISSSAMRGALGDASLFPRFQALVALRELPAQPHLVASARRASRAAERPRPRVYVPADVCARSAATRRLARHSARDDATGESAPCRRPRSIGRPSGAAAHVR